jgi:hypothetical protein
MFLRLTWMSVLLAFAACGCSTRGDLEMLESELRRQEDLRIEAEQQVTSLRQELHVARNENAQLHAQLRNRGDVSLVSEQVAVLSRVEDIKFNMLLTSGLDRDGEPGDEALSVLIMPVDEAGDLIKLPGVVELDLHDLSRPPNQQRIGAWKFGVDDVRERWHKGFLAAGYLFQLDWQNVPVSSELTLHARLIAPDGRRFDATTQLKVTPPGPGRIASVSRALNSDRSDAVRTSDNWTDETIPRLR